MLLSPVKQENRKPSPACQELTHVDTEEACKPVQVVLIPGHLHHLGDDCVLGPLRTKLLYQLLQVLGGRVANREHMVHKPRHAEGVELLVEELDTQLPSEQRHVLDDGEADAPLGVLGQLHDGRQQALGQLLDANHLHKHTR